MIELNGAVDFDDPEYSPPGDNFYDRIAEALELDRLAAAAEPAAAEAGIV